MRPKRLRRSVVYALALCGLASIVQTAVRAAVPAFDPVVIECQDQTATLRVLRGEGTIVGATFSGPGNEPGFLVAQGGATALLLLPEGRACVLPLAALTAMVPAMPLPGDPL
jgi:hypothetical protein